MKNNKIIINLFLAVSFMLFILTEPLLTSISANEAASNKELKQQNNPYANAQIAIKIIPSAKKTYGYDIFVNGRQLVHQQSIPGLPGNKGFTTKKKAQTVAEFVVNKLRTNEMPPTVSIEDLNSMGVLK